MSGTARAWSRAKEDHDLTSGRGVLAPRPWYVVVAAAAVLTLAMAVGGEGEVALGLTAFFLFALVPLRWPLEGAYLVLLLGWLPFEDLFGSERSLFASIGGLNVSGMRLLGGIVGLGLAVIALRGKLRSVTLPHWVLPGVVVYAAFVTWSAVTLLWAPEFVDGARGVAKFGFPLLVAATVLADPYNWGPRRLIRTTAVVLGAALLLATLYGFAGVADRTLLPTVETGWVAESYGWAGWSSMGFLAGIVGVVFLALGDHGVPLREQLSQRRNHLVLWGIAILAFVQIPLALKRISVGAAGVGVSVYLLLGGSRRLLVPIGVVLAASALLFFPPLVERNVYRPNPSAQGVPEQVNDTSAELSVNAVGNLAMRPSEIEKVIKLEGRNELWEAAIKSMEGRDWIIGTGINAWSARNFGKSGWGQLHGEPVRALYETGAIGLLLVSAAFGILFLAFARLAVRSARRTTPRALGAAGAGVVALYVITGLTDNTLDYYLIGSYAWTVFAMAALSARLPDGRTPPASAATRSRTGGPGLVATAAGPPPR